MLAVDILKLAELYEERRGEESYWPVENMEARWSAV